MKIGIIILARMGASRLPGKVLLEVCGKPILEHVVSRLQKVDLADQVIVATTQNSNDDVIESFCKQTGVECFRGSEDNVLDRCIQATKEFGLDIVVRLGADSALADREVINDMLKTFMEERERGNELEYLSNSLDRSFPIGIDAEIFDSSTFLRIDNETRSLSPEERRLNEINVVPYLHQHLDLFRTYSYKKEFDHTHHRWTLDTPEDFDLISKIYTALYPHKPDFLMQDILDLLKENPDWPGINSDVIPVSGHWTDAEKKKLEDKIKKQNANL